VYFVKASKDVVRGELTKALFSLHCNLERWPN